MQEPPPQETLITEPIPTKGNTEVMQLKALTMGEEKPFNKSFLHSIPKPQFNPFDTGISREDVKMMREARVKALDKPLTIKQEAEAPPTIPEAISPETQVTPERDPERDKLAKLKNSDLQNILLGLGGNITNDSPKKGYKNKQTLVTSILTRRNANPSKFTELLNTIK